MEGSFHKFLKLIIAQELEKQNYTIYYEPLESPVNQLWWHSYRPDILATQSSESNLKIVLVECETQPSRKRVQSKTTQIRHCLSFQKRLHEKASILPLLIIPTFFLNKIICSKIRKFWDIWIVNPSGEINHKISRLIDNSV